MGSARTVPKSADVLPPLANGDRLTRAEFHRRYERMPHLKKAELIEGVVYMPSPVRVPQHAQPHAHLATWLGYYFSKTLGLGSLGDNGTVRLDEDNEVQPDLFLLLPRSAGGAAEVDADGYVSGPPELVCEVSSSTVSIDLNTKMNAYRRNGVREYLVWRVDEGAVDGFALRNGQYERLRAASNGNMTLKSEVFPGLWLDATALMRGDLAGVLACVERGTASAAHSAFVRRLRKTSKT